MSDLYEKVKEAGPALGQLLSYYDRGKEWSYPPNLADKKIEEKWKYALDLIRQGNIHLQREEGYYYYLPFPGHATVVSEFNGKVVLLVETEDKDDYVLVYTERKQS